MGSFDRFEMIQVDPPAKHEAGIELVLLEGRLSTWSGRASPEPGTVVAASADEHA